MKIFLYYIILAFITKCVFSCGSTLFKIINGETASTWTWMVSLTTSRNDAHLCGGSLISPQFVLTAAHCLNSLPSIYIVAGTNDLNDVARKTYQVLKQTLHEDYNSNTFENDIALIKLTEPIIESSRISTICLPNSTGEKNIIDQQVYTAGWGYTSPSGPTSSDILFQTTMQIYENSTICPIPPNLHYCAFDASSKESNTCFGDSGGPLMYLSNGKWYLYGLTSFGFTDSSGNCLNTRPSYFTKVPRYLEWISVNMNSSGSDISNGFNFQINFLVWLIYLLI